MTEVFAERAIFGVIDGTETKVVVRIQAPEQDDQVGGDWLCRFTFHADDHAPVLEDGAGHGIDGIQALIGALHAVGWTLDRSNVEWSMFSEEDLHDQAIIQFREDGFPRAGLSVMFLGSAFRKRIESYVEGEKLEALKSVSRPKRPPTP